MTRKEALQLVPDEKLLRSLAALGLLKFDDDTEPGGGEAGWSFARTEPPPEWRDVDYHWLRLRGVRRSPCCVAWQAGGWLSHPGQISPEEMHRRGWRWYAPALPPAEWNGTRVDAP